MNLQSAIYNLLLNACQAATRSIDMPVVEVFLVEVDQWLYVTILDNGPGVPASVRDDVVRPVCNHGKAQRNRPLGSPWLVGLLKSMVVVSSLRNRIQRGRYSP